MNRIAEYPVWRTRRSPDPKNVDDPRYTDYIPVIEWVDTDQWGRTHLVQIDVQRNDDIPYEREFVNMGLDTEPNIILDNEAFIPGPGHMNDRDFRHRCVRYGNVLLKMFEKRGPDYDSNIYAHADRLEEWLGCEYVDAYTIGGTIRRLQLGKTNGRRLIFGYTQADGTRRRGLQDVGSKAAQHYAERLESIVEGAGDLPEPGTNAPRTLEDERQYYYDVACKLVDSGQLDNDPVKIADYIEQSAVRDSMLPSDPDDGRGVSIYNGLIDVAHLDDDDEWWVVLHDQDLMDEEDLDFSVDPLGGRNDMAVDDGIGTHPLGHGDDYIDLDYIERIKHADPKELKVIQSEFFRQQDDWTGKVYPPKNRWMNDSQRRASWWYINSRKEALTEQARANVSRDAAQVIDLLNQMDFLPQMRALIGCFSRGRAFNYYGDKMSWTKPCESDVWACWSVYRERESVLA